MPQIFDNFKNYDFFSNLIEYGRFGALHRRIKELPYDYRFVYRKIQSYMWNHTEEDDTNLSVILDYQFKLMDLFEASAAERKNVLEITGKDVAVFCDKVINKSMRYTEYRRRALNRGIHRKLGKWLYWE